MRLWHLPSDGSAPSCTHTLLHHGVTVWAVAFSPNGTQLASSAGDGSVQLWRLHADGSAVTSKALRGGAAIAYNPRGRQLFCSSSDGSFYVYL